MILLLTVRWDSVKVNHSFGKGKVSDRFLLEAPVSLFPVLWPNLT